MSAEQLVAVYNARFDILAGREEGSRFGSNGRKIAGDRYAYGYGQTEEQEHFVQLQGHLESPDTEPPPEGCTPPFHKADREAEYRQAHAVFSERLRAARGE